MSQLVNIVLPTKDYTCGDKRHNAVHYSAFGHVEFGPRMRPHLAKLDRAMQVSSIAVPFIISTSRVHFDVLILRRKILFVEGFEATFNLTDPHEPHSRHWILRSTLSVSVFAFWVSH